MGDRLATIDMGRNVGGLLCALCFFFWGGGGGSPSNTMWPGPTLTSIPSASGILLIHPTVWHPYTNVRDRQDTIDRADNGPIA